MTLQNFKDYISELVDANILYKSFVYTDEGITALQLVKKDFSRN